MSNVSSRIAQLAVSQTLAMSQKSRELQEKGHDVINLSVGEPDFDTPEYIKEAAIQAIKENYTHYTPVPGYTDLRRAIVEKFKRENNLDYTTEQIVVSSGAKHSLSNILQVIVEKGEEVIVPAPYWVSYVEMVKLAEGKNVIVPTSIESDFKVTPEQLKEVISPKTKAVFLCSPSNPTGSIYTREELKALADFFASLDQEIYILSDEIYEHINFTGKHESIAQFENIKERVIVINGVSKGYAMTGWRIGYIAAPEWIAKASSKLQGQTTSGSTAVSQRAALAALNGGMESIFEMKKAFQRRRDLVIKLLSKIEGMKINKPGGAFYMFPKIDSFFGKKHKDGMIENAQDLCMYLLEKGHVATVPGDAFGSPGYFRLSYAASDDELKEAISRIDKALSNLK